MKNIACVIAAVMCVNGAVLAQEEDSSSAENSGGAEVAGELGVQTGAPAAKRSPFHTIPTCRKIEGVVEVLRAGAVDWEAAEEGRFYPLGTSYRTVGKDSRLTVELGHDCKVVIIGEASFGTRNQPLTVKSRSISLQSGVITVKLPLNFPEGMLDVSAPGFKVVNPAGESRYRYIKTGDGDRATVRCISGSLAIEGRHFKILSMHAANEADIRTSQDLLFTGIYGKRGDYMIKLDQGYTKIRDVETGDERIEEKVLEWKISPQTAVRIHRSVPAIGENMAVTVMTFDAAGTLKNRCAFTEKRFEVNSGELAPVSKGSREALAKKVSEAVDGDAGTETVEVVPEEDGGESADEKSSDDDLDF